MGNRISNALETYEHPDAPKFNHKPVYDPLYGFTEERKRRVMVATEAEMESAAVPVKERNFCSHKRIEYLACRRQNLPFHKYKCAHEHHEYATCEYEDWIIRMKDYERERRLAARKRRLEKAAGA